MNGPPREIFLFPLGTVLFPGGVLPLKVFEQRYVEMTKACLRDGRPFGVCLIKEGHEVGTPAVPERTGCYARIAEWDMPQLGLFLLQTRGEGRFRVIATQTGAGGLISGTVEPFEAETTQPEVDPVCRELLAEVVRQVGADRFSGPVDLDDASWVSYRLAEMLPLAMPLRQALLEMPEAGERLARLRAEIERLGLDQREPG